MRLIRLKIRNIASLKGEHEVDFQDIQKESPLFAITGETGSGKSTILNCIGLALYGQIYKKNVTQPDVVTLGEKEGSIELIFQVKGKFYLTDWRIRVRKQNGEPYSTPQSAVRNLYTIEGSDFNSPKNIATTNATELLNLDFDQFCKCIILNQGEFARFLTSSFTDRKEILEKLYPGELLDNISRELDQEKKSLEKAKHDLEIELHTLRGDNLPGEALQEEKKKLEIDLITLDENFKKIELLDYHFVSLFSYFDKFGENERRKAQIKADMVTETTKYNHLLSAGEALSNEFQAAKKRQETEIPVLQTYLEKEGTLKHLEESDLSFKSKITALTGSISEYQKQMAVKEAQESELRHKLKTLSDALTHSLSDLRAARDTFSTLFDLFSESELLSEEIRGKAERLKELEGSGKELKALVESIEESITKLPSNATELESEIQKKKSELQVRIDKKQRSLINAQELIKQIESMKSEISGLQEKISALNILIGQTKEEILPLEATLKLQELLNATEICVDHVLTEEKESCPVCETKIDSSRWGDIRTRIKNTDLKSIRKRFEEGDKLIFKSQKEVEHYSRTVENLKDTLTQKESEHKGLQEALTEVLPAISDIDQELDSIRKKSLELSQLKKERESKNIELQRIRTQYKTLRDELTEREKALALKSEKLSAISGTLQNLIPVINKDTIRDLKIEVKDFNAYLDEENHLEKVLQEKTFLLSRKTDATKELEELKRSSDENSARIQKINTELNEALNGEKASVLIQKINSIVKSATETWSKHSEEQKRQELVLKDSQGRLYTLEELTKDIDLQFIKELHTVRSLAAFTTHRPESDHLLSKLTQLDLNFKSPRELFIPLGESLKKEKEFYKGAGDECRMLFASVSTKLSAWEKLQDKILLLEFKAKDINTELERKMRLFEVLGKDELRTFVLSLVEESLIVQTNEELQKLCQGRYEIVHQTKSMKMAPEFYMLDKFREGGKRKVSTLSGGETFMVSIAMALGLAEMTRGQAEIDSLFIDEGFGTLDQDSLEDVLDMLQQIQTRGLMVGIISHIKPLTSALPVNLVLNKKSDGTSGISVQRN